MVGGIHFKVRPYYLEVLITSVNSNHLSLEREPRFLYSCLQVENGDHLGELRRGTTHQQEETDSRSNGGKKHIIKVKADANYLG